MIKKVKCIAIRETVPDQLVVDKEYLIDTDTLYGDQDGDWYVKTFDIDKNPIGSINIKHFCEV